MTGSTTKRITTALAAALLTAVLPLSARAASPRVAHTATLLTSGDVLIAGGVDNTGTVLNTTDIFGASRDNVLFAGNTLGTARSSHTATLLPNGCVLAAGGSTTAGATPTASAEVYDPSTSNWGPVTGGPQLNLITARFNHTATLLNNGKVLICGGQDAAGAPIASGLSCEFYTPGATCRAGNFSAAPSLLLSRYNHTATLLKDGKVWFAGGSTTAASGFAQTSTTERYDPSNGANGSFQSASPLIESRAYHNATLMGDGKVLVSGGYNQKNFLANFGILQSAEIYDPVANNVTPAAPMVARRMQHSAVLGADGTVLSVGGLGNVTTAYLNASGPLKPGSILKGTLSALTTTNLTAASVMLLDEDFLLSQPVQGEIQDGEIWFSSPAVHFPSGQTNFVPADPNSGNGIRMSLNGKVVGCRFNNGTVAGNCGNVQGQDFPLTSIQGQTVFYPLVNLVPNGSPAISAGKIIFSGGPLTQAVGQLGITSAGSSFTTTLSIPMASELIGGQILAGAQMGLVAATFVQTDSFSVTLNGGVGTLAANANITLDPITQSGVATFPITFTNLNGVIAWAGGDVSYSTTSPVTIPATGLAVPVNITSTFNYVASQVDVSGKQFTVDIATIVVRKMVFADREHYNPSANVWTLTTPSGAAEPVSPVTDQRFGASSTLLPTNDVLIYGGKACLGATCATTPASTSLGLQLLNSEANFAASIGNITTRRAFHTSTLLPTGQILVAGGTNGPNILKSAELFDPATESFFPTNSSLNEVRDLHTATLMPNGRVLIAGGFTTNATSTGSTNSVEVYYPDTKVFIPTEPMFSSRSNHSALVMPDGKVFVAGGFGDADVVTGTAEIYISTESRWIQAAGMPVGCERAIAASVQLKDGRILLFGGINANGILSSVAAYTPGTNSWSCVSVTPMPTALRSATATLLFDGRVLVAGGNDGFGEANVSYTWSPLSNAWAATAATPFLEPRFNHTATLLPDGSVMVTGGSQRFGNVPTSIEVFHVNGSSWVAGAMKFASGNRAFHTMTLANNNKVYAIGGSDGVIGGTGVSLWAPAEGGYFMTTPDTRSKGGPPSARQSTITVTTPSIFLPNTALTVTGNQFRGGTEASGGGSASANSSFSYPKMILQQLDSSGGAASQSNGGFAVDLTTQIYLNPGNFATLNTAVTVQLPLTSNALPFGWYALRMGANGIYSNAAFVQAGPAKPVAAPAGVVGNVQGISSITWTWNQIAGVDGYNVYNATTNVFISSVAPTATPTFTQTGLSPSATASILISAYSLSGDGPLTAGPTTYALSTTPINVNITSVTFSDLLLYWNVNGNATPGTVYEVSESSDNFATNFSTPVPTIFNLTTNFATISNLAANSTYYFRVRAFNPVGNASPFSISVGTITRAGVSQPSVGARTTTSIDWNWVDPGGVTNFHVWNATSNVLLATIPGNLQTYSDVGLSTNAIRSVRVSAVTGAGEGPLSPSASAYTLAATPILFSPPIPVVTLTTGSFQLNWTGNGNPLTTPYTAIFTSYNNNLVAVSTFGGTTTGFSRGAGNLQPSALFGYSLIATNGDGIPTAPALVGSTWTLPTPPNPLIVTNTSPSSISVDWSPNGNTSSTTYQLTYSTDNFLTSVSTPIPFSLQFNATSFTIPGLQTSTSYTIQVVARNVFGQASAPVQVTTSTFNGGAAPGSISGVIAEANNSEITGSLGNGRVIDLRVPAHTFSTDITLTISSTTPGAMCPNGVNIGFSIVDAPALQPNKSLYLTYGFTLAELGAIAPSRALLMRYDPVSNTCVPLETTVDAATGRMTARINHFSLFQVAQIPLQANTDFARVFPNPYYAGRDGFITIDQIPPGARVRVFTLRGELVLDQFANASGLLTWSGTNGSGRAVASGVYMIMVESGSNKKIMKVAVIR